MDGPRPGGFWIRAAAATIDLVLFALVERSFVVVARLIHGVGAGDAWAVGFTVLVFTLVFAAAYTATLHAFGGQTVGKLLVGVRVVALDGEPPALGQAFLRWLAYGVSLVPFGLGYLMAGLRQDRRALHDLIAGTRVERIGRRAPAAGPAAEAQAEPASPVA